MHQTIVFLLVAVQNGTSGALAICASEAFAGMRYAAHLHCSGMFRLAHLSTNNFMTSSLFVNQEWAD
jgi:hypothetical protein